MNENKVPCGGVKVDPLVMGVKGEKLYFRPESIDGYGFMHGYCATLREHVNESSGIDEWIMDTSDIGVAGTNAINGVPVFVQIMTYNGMDNGTAKYIYSTGNLCYFEEGEKLIFSCPFSQGSMFVVKFYDVNINTGIATVTTKELS